VSASKELILEIPYATIVALGDSLEHRAEHEHAVVTFNVHLELGDDLLAGGTASLVSEELPNGFDALELLLRQR